MANGSFGLSGLPSAPTSVGVAPNNPFTPVSVAVNSTAGFQAGDLVYNFGGDIAPVPNNYVSTGTFPITDNLPVVQSNSSYGELYASPITKGTVYRDNFSAKLTDGNIVVVYLLATPSNNNQPYFKVVSESGAVVVTDTLISTAIGGYGTIRVCALTGGGFAVGWRNPSTSNPYYAIYANPSGGSCATVLAATQDTGFTFNSNDSQYLQLIARPNGSWIFAGVNTSNIVNHKIFSATGVQVYNWTTGASAQAASYWWKYVVRSDGSFVLITPNASSQLAYTVFSAVNAVVVSTATLTTAASPANISNAGGVDVFSNDTVIVAFANGSTPYYVTLSSANVLGTATAYTFTGVGSYNWFLVKPRVLANGNYVLSATIQDTGLNNIPAYTLSYVVLNASHVAQTTIQTISSFSTGSLASPDVVETSSFINFLGAPASWSFSLVTNWNAGAPSSLQWAKASPSTYLPIKSSSVSALVGTSSAQSVSGYARSVSTPTSAAFFASTSGTVSSSVSAGAVVVAQTAIDISAVCYGIDTASLSDGSCLILYRLGSPTFSIKLAVISPVGALTATYTVVASAATTANLTQGQTKLAVLTDGKIAVTYLDSSNIAQLVVLSSTYSVVAGPVAYGGEGTTSTGIGLAALSGGRFVIAYKSTSNSWPAFRVYDSSLTSLVAETNVFTSNTASQAISCASYPGGFLVTFTNTSNGVFFAYSYIETTTNSFTASTGDQVGTSTFNRGQKSVSGSNGSVYSISFNDAGAVNPSLYLNTGGSRTIQTRVLSGMMSASGNGSTGMALALTSYNEPVFFAFVSSTVIRMMYNTSSLGIAPTGTYFEFTSVFSYPSSIANNIMVGGTLAGHNVVLALLNSSNFLTYTVISPTNYTYSSSLTAGVTPANPVAINSTKGFSLVGVSSTAAPANGQGTVVINGPAQLSSSYSASTAGQSFNFGNNVTFGAAGTISGRNVNLIGNV